MKSRLLPAIIAAVTLFSLVTSFLILRKNQNEREKYETFLLENGQKAGSPESEGAGKSLDEPQMSAFQDFLQTVDPKERRVPVERLRQAYNDLRASQPNGRLKDGNILLWDLVPSNMGGRTRVVMYDPNSLNGNKVWAGAVTGGLWYNENITSAFSSWIPVNDFWPSLAISSITFDPINKQTFYVGTGEAFTSRVIYRESSGVGVGIFKSTDGGQTWQQLPSTSDWKYVTDIEVRNESGNSVIYAGVASGEYHGPQQSEPTDGLYRSTDGGDTWVQVLPLVEGTNKPYAVADIEITAGNRIMIGSMPNQEGNGGATILYSDNGTSGTWTVYDNYKTIIEASSDMNIPNRVMIGSAPSDPNVAYALLDAGYVNSDNGFVYTQGLYILRTDNAGSTWVSKPMPSGGDYYWATIGWHALTLAVDQNNADALYIGGLDVYKSINGGNNWTQVSDWWYMYYGGGDLYVHADIHDIDYKPGSSSELLVSSDGGVFYTDEALSMAPAFQEKNLGYGTLQFYTCAINSTAGSVNYLGGLQDNGTLYHTGTPLTINDMIDDGDGSGCFIDQTQPQYMITSVYYNAYTLWLNGNYDESMSNWSSGTFISAADYDYNSNILFANACSFGGNQANQLLRISGIPNNISGTFINLNTGLNVYYSAVEYSPHSPENTSTIYAGSLSGRLFRVTNAQAIPQVIEITGADFPVGAISCVAIGGSDDTLLVTFSNYGLSSVWQTYDGGTNWEEKEANLPDIPIRWALYHPGSAKYAMLATELGIWTTSNLDEPGTVWIQNIDGLANVRIDMLQIRLSDYTVIAATHGRGLATATWDIATGIAGPDANMDVSIYPNPTTGQFKVQSSKFEVSVESYKVEVVDMFGKVVKEAGKRGSSEAGISFNISDLPAGIYFARISSLNSLVLKKIVKL